jgi:phthiodiolone/phenolphthiodiolone dimycocerosates ketoreductase
MPQVKFGTPGPYFPPIDGITKGAKYLEDAGVDYLFNGDQTMLVLPRSMLRSEYVPGAASGVDLDRWMEGFMYKAVTAMATERVGIGLCVDSIRRHPSLLAQQILSMDHISSGRFFLHIGAGEQKQFRPYGIERKRPFLHLEEGIKIIKLLMDSDEPVDYEGPLWTLNKALIRLEPYDPANPPKLLVLGGPGKSVEVASRVGDGWSCFVPPSGDAEWYGEQVATIKCGAERRGVDPDSLMFHVMTSCLIYEHDSEREFLENNLALRFHAAIEVPGADATWKRWGGGESPFGRDFYYSRDFVSTEWSLEDCLKIAHQVDPAMVKRSKLLGTPREVADQVQPYIEAGATHVGVGNFATLLTTGDWGDASEKRNLALTVIDDLRERNGIVPAHTA